MTIKAHLAPVKSVLLGTCLAFGVHATPVMADDATTQQSDVFDCEPHLTNCDVDPSGSAQLLREGGYVTANVVTSNLNANAAYTMWWVVFNNPDECVGPCNEPDLFVAAVDAAVIWATGTLSTPKKTGNFVATLGEGPTGVDQPFFPEFVFGDQLNVGGAQAAEIHLVIRFHDQVNVDADDLRGRLRWLL